MLPARDHELNEAARKARHERAQIVPVGEDGGVASKAT
jgi:hypothetical protein